MGGRELIHTPQRCHAHGNDDFCDVLPIPGVKGHSGYVFCPFETTIDISQCFTVFVAGWHMNLAR